MVHFSKKPLQMWNAINFVVVLIIGLAVVAGSTLAQESTAEPKGVDAKDVDAKNVDAKGVNAKNIDAQWRELAAIVKPVFDESTMLFAHVSPDRLDQEQLLSQMRRLLPTKPIWMLAQFTERFVQLEKIASEFDAAHVFMTLSLYDIERGPMIAIPVGSQQAISKLSQTVNGWKISDYEPYIVNGNLFVFSHKLARLRVEEALVTGRADLATILSTRLDAVASMHFVPSKDHLRVIRELMPQLQKPFDDVNGEMVADGIQSMSVRLSSIEPMQIKFSVRSSDRKAAERIASRIEILKRSWKADDLHGMMLAGLLAQLELKTTDSGLTLDLGEKEQQLWMAIRPLFSSANRQMRVSSETRNIRQLMLGLHNFHDTQKRFPDLGPSVFPPKTGLSWRVWVLPYMDEIELYNSFHHDEPWDSEHNKSLLSKMPAVYASHGLVPADGKTSIVMPRGEKLFAKPFPKEGEKDRSKLSGRRMRDILDGTSNSIALIKVPNELAVPWTKPADWEPNLDQNLAEVFEKAGWKDVVIGMADGSTRRLTLKELKSKKFRALLTIAGAEIIE